MGGARRSSNECAGWRNSHWAVSRMRAGEVRTMAAAPVIAINESRNGVLRQGVLAAGSRFELAGKVVAPQCARSQTFVKWRNPVLSNRQNYRYTAPFGLSQDLAAVAPPLPEWASRSTPVDQFFVLGTEEQKWPRKLLPSPPLAVSYIPPTPVGTVPTVARRWTPASASSRSSPKAMALPVCVVKVKGRGGKTVTTITGVPLPLEQLKELASTLKRRCGTGGAQGWGHRDSGRPCRTVARRADQTGFKAKKSGG